MKTISLKQPSKDNQTILSITASLAKFKRFSEKMEDAKLKPFEHFTKIKLVKNQKNPIKDISWKSPRNQSYHIPINFYNVGIPTGRANNLIVVDVDIKKEYKDELDGVAKMQEYTGQHQEIKTLTVRTPSGGTHYYFRYESSNDNIKFIIINYLQDRQGVGGYGIDIRSVGGYIIARQALAMEKHTR